jgi:hypothetical protein
MNRTPFQHPVVRAVAALLLGGLAGCASAASPPRAESAPAQEPRDPNSVYASTYRPLPSSPVLITGATVLTAAGDRIENGSVLMRDGRIAAVGQGLEAPADATVVDARDKWVTPGVIDAHSHLGAFSSPAEENSDENELTDPVTADVWIERCGPRTPSSRSPWPAESPRSRSFPARAT